MAEAKSCKSVLLVALVASCLFASTFQQLLANDTDSLTTADSAASSSEGTPQPASEVENVTTTSSAPSSSTPSTTTTTTTTTTMNPRFGWPATSEPISHSSVAPASSSANPWPIDSDDSEPRPRDYAKDPPRDEEDFVQYTQHLVNTFSEQVDTLVTEQLPFLLSFVTELDLSPDCNYAFLNVYLAARQFQPWAIRMLDAIGKVPEGILHGQVTSFGSYDECLNIVADDGSENDVPKGKYCSIKVRPFLPPDNGQYKRTKLTPESVNDVAAYFRFVQFHLGVCVPSVCTLEDMSKFASLATGVTKMNVTATRCEMKEPLTFSNEEMVGGCVVAAFLLVVLFGTAIDVVRQVIKRRAYDTPQKPGPLARLFQAFSLYSNGERLFNTKTRDDEVLPLHGLRVLSILWVILGHSYLSFQPKTSAGVTQIQKAVPDTFFQIVTNADLASDTFFFVSGFLVCYLALKKLRENKGKFNIFLFYLHRYLRMTPPIMMLLAFTLFAHRLGDGPLWHEIVDEKVNTCKRMWWTNLVYITNFLKREDICFTHLWYISADMQFYILSPIIFIFLYRKKKIGKILIALGVCACIIVSAILTYVNGYPPALLFNDVDPGLRRQYYYNIFRMPFYHGGVYLIGMASAYLFSRHKKMKINVIFQLIGWCATTAICLSIIFSTAKWNDNELPTTIVSTFYSSLSRTAWAICIAWIALMCASGHGGIIRSILTWKLFVPLSRVSYLAFLIHPAIITVYIGQTRVPLYYGHFNAIYVFMGHTMVTYISSFLLSFAVEMPFRRLDRVFCKGDPEDNLNMLSCVCDDNQSGSFTTTAAKDDGTMSTGWTDKLSPHTSQADDKNATELPKIVVQECHL